MAVRPYILFSKPQQGFDRRDTSAEDEEYQSVRFLG
jgi:hypothetical protein